MDRTHQLEAIEKLISYSGLGNAKARDLLEKCNWNVDAAYRLYKKQQMEQAGFKHTVTAQSNRFSEPVQYGSGSRQEGVFARPSSQFYGQYGTVTTGNGPAVGVLCNQGYQQSSSIPKFPVEQRRERIIPIQVERRPVGREQPVRQPFFPVPNNVPLEVKTKPNMTYKPMVQPSEVTLVDENSQTNPKQNYTVHINAPSSHSTTKKKQTDDDLLVEIDDQPAHLPSMKSQQNKDSLENSPSTEKMTDVD